MTMSKDTLIGLLIVLLVCSFMVNVAQFFAPRVRTVEVEIAPKPTEDPLAFYSSVLRSQNITVTEQPLAVNNFVSVSFNEFLWIIREANITEVFFDQKRIVFPLNITMPKLWVQIDGVYYEVRFET